MLLHHSLGARVCLRHSCSLAPSRRIPLRAALDSEAPSRYRPEEPNSKPLEEGLPTTSGADVPTPSSNQEEVERWLQELGMSEVGALNF